MTNRRTHARPRLLAALVGTLVLAPALAYASELRMSGDPLETDDSGKLTQAGRSAASKEIKLDNEPGEELWTLHLWAKLDSGAPGPLYVEFLGKLPSGKDYTTLRHEYGEYGGEKYVEMTLDLEGNTGFNKNRSYKVRVLQVNARGKDLVMATGMVTLNWVEAQDEDEPEDEEAEGEEGGEDEEDYSKQDELDTLVGGEEPAGDGQEGPPPVEPPVKSGCSVDPSPFRAPGLLVLFALGAGLARPRARS